VQRLLAAITFALPLLADCRLPEPVPNAPARLSPARLLEGGHYLTAERVLETAIKNRPASEPSNGRLEWMLSKAKASLAQGDVDKLEEALALAEKALAADPNNGAYRVQVAATSARLAEKASLFKKLGYIRRAKQELDAAAADASQIDAQWGLMLYYYAAPPLVGGDKAKAKQIADRLAATVPDLGRYYAGRLALELKEPEKAENFYKLSASENPLLFDTASALAMFYVRTKPDQAKAERWACQAVHTDPDRADAWALLARVHTMCGCWTEAVALAERAERTDPENLSAYFAIAEAAIERGEQYGLAEAFLRKYLEKPIEGDQPSEALARMHLGTALAKLGRTAEATRELKAALELDSTLDAAKQELKKLRP
jgi:tetratricopeptide (TPR) repeat protein